MLKSNELLEDICDRLAGLTPNWSGTIRKLKEQRPDMCSKKIYMPEIRSHISEVYLQVSLNKICRDWKRVDLHPVVDGDSSANYGFRVSNGRLVVFKKGGDPYTDYDALIRVDGLPVIFEVKLSRLVGSKKGTDAALQPDRISYVSAPVREFFGTEDFGYVAIITRENLKDSPLQQEFKKNGGILVPFFWSYETFRAKVKLYSKKYKLYD